MIKIATKCLSQERNIIWFERTIVHTLLGLLQNGTCMLITNLLTQKQQMLQYFELDALRQFINLFTSYAISFKSPVLGINITSKQ